MVSQRKCAMKFIAEIDYGLGQFITLLLAILVLWGTRTLPYLTQMVGGDPFAKDEMRQKARQLLRWAVIFFSVVVIAVFIGMCVLNGTFGQWMSALRK